ncbi:MAG TPA: ABC transporter, partial [Microbacteriaceae bacterium]|nr:ABC transporter [Microbacteriaceae bacterium]
MISISGLRKSFGSKIAVNDVSFEVEKGSLFAFLGTNGAGKSTTINCLTTLMSPDAGKVELGGFQLGRDDHKIRSLIGTVFQDSVLDPLLTARENLELKAALYGVEDSKARIDQLSALIDLGDFITQRYGILSGGQKRRVDIARALVHQPRVLFLDEPTAGLDLHSRDIVWSTLQEIRESLGLTIFLTTHYM